MTTTMGELVLQFQEGENTLSELLEHPNTMRIVKHAARKAYKYKPGWIDWDDLVQQACIFIVKIAAKWNPEGGTFEAYLSTSLHWSLQKWLCRTRGTARSYNVRIYNRSDEELAPLETGAEDEEIGWTEIRTVGERIEDWHIVELHAVERLGFTDIGK
jgi:DNA-directed RNA polymerase specialized sigma24 family protein